MWLLFILQLPIISVAPVHASQNISLATTKASNKTATDALLGIIKNKETTSDEIIALIDKNADINAKDEYGRTALIWAACNGLEEVCITLMDKGADVNASDRVGWTSLILAAGKGPTVLCILLLRHMLLKQLLATDPEGESLSARRTRMRCAILILTRNSLNKNLITLIVTSKPLLLDYAACGYDTYCCRSRLNKYPLAITRDELYNLLRQSNIDTLKAAMQGAYYTCFNDPVLKNLLNPANFDQHFDELFLNPLKPTLKPIMGE